MPLGKYFCDYCKKEFHDTRPTRRRHLQRGQHLRARAQRYASFKDPNHAYPGSLTKGVCNRFVNTESCPYGDSCKHLHPKNNQQGTVLIDTNQSVGGSSLPDVVVRDHTGMSWSNLPPSLLPPPEGGYPRLPFVDWG